MTARTGENRPAALRGLDKLIALETGMSVAVAQDPLDCVVNGASMALEQMAPARRRGFRLRPSAT